MLGERNGCVLMFSLNEIEVMGKRAARGAGLSWGMAEEAGKAVRWLYAHGLPGTAMLADLLTRNDGRCYDDLVPVPVEGVWHACSGQLCPLIAGAALEDRAQSIAAGHEIRLGPTAYPLLLAPYAAAVAATTNLAVALSWAGVAMTFERERVAVEPPGAAVLSRCAPDVRCRLDGNGTATPSPRTALEIVDATAWSRLDAFAQRTFAPATEASRLVGAGAGLADSD